MHDLSGKVALVIGLGQSSPRGWGIGCTIAVLLARQGAIIVGGNRTVASAHITKDRIEAEGGKCEIYATDATSSASVEKLVSTCMHRHRRIDILINNVGKSALGDPATMSEDVWNSQIDLNLKSGDGRVVSISSIAGLRYIGKPQIGYSATKAAIVQTMKATAVMYASRGVRLNTVVPGLMYTPYTEELAERYGASEPETKKAYMKTRKSQVPMEKMGDAWDVAHAVLFLVSDEAKYITGTELLVDGGITASTGRA
ncbi:uncharacterized protein HMPREF1541_01700 [Cyphellophora europaea CBS 101466]|uniref:3-oxoacyl-[acyl-carrier-protein] reductase n=1 Tax=Cyphellophora europaea (strain CBS 101466) TaxID=1220924 RepID=W2S3D2_CYPE1|nr:uncharacterized protein HMPREF1541_01700 [Cyphellophora europaea CBS 101466]ETN42543.1 hypothetical protein HMPREF1541_01700 [Cyphellophora europaea CBS 101466]